MMSEREDVAAKRARCMAAQGAFKEALGALEVLPQQLVTLTSRASQPLPPDLAWSEAAHNAKKAAVTPGERSSMHGWASLILSRASALLLVAAVDHLTAPALAAAATRASLV